MTATPLRSYSKVRNPYWEAVEQYASPVQGLFCGPGYGGLEIGGLQSKDALHAWSIRNENTSRFSWTITNPEAVMFVAEHAGHLVLDPIAGTGYWGWLLNQLGVDCLSYDLYPPHARSESNQYHRHTDQFVTVHRADVTQSVPMHGARRTLLLSWPPFNDPTGYEALAAYTGDKVIYIGEGEGGCTGDDRFHALLESGWDEIDYHRPVQYFGIHDYIHVYERNAAGTQT